MKDIKDGEKVYYMVLLGAKGIDKAVKTGFSERQEGFVGGQVTE